MRRRGRLGALLLTALAVVGLLTFIGPLKRQPHAEAAPTIIVVETTKGSFTFETFPADARATVAHVAALVRSGFYDGQRVHRAIPGLIVQFGDPRSRDLEARALWGKGPLASSGHPVGVTEISKKHVHRK